MSGNEGKTQRQYEALVFKLEHFANLALPKTFIGHFMTREYSSSKCRKL